MRRNAACALALAVIVLSAGPARATAPTYPPSSRVLALSDIASVPDTATALASLQILRPSVCHTRAASDRRAARVARVPNKGVALADARRLLTRKARAGFARFNRSAVAHNAHRAQRQALAGFLAHSPGATLAALLAEQSRDPRDPRPLINLAALLSRLGKPNDSLALTSAALKLRFPSSSPMGIDLRALAYNERGFALFELRQYGAGVRALQTAIAREPLLSEAQSSLAGALLCEGRVQQAAAPYIASQRRNRFGTAIAAGTTFAPPGQSIDLSHGVTGQLPAVQLPANPDDGAASAQQFSDEQQNRFQQGLQLLSREGQLSVGLAPLAARSPAQYLRTYHTFALITNWKTLRPDIGALYQALVDTHGPLLAAQRKFFIDDYPPWGDSCNTGSSSAMQKCRRDACVPALQSAHASWLTLMRDADAKARRWMAAYYTYTTGVAANLASPLAHEIAMDLIRGPAYTAYSAYVLGPAAVWTSSEQSTRADCTDPSGTNEAETDSGELPESPQCPPSTEAVKFHISLGVASVEVDCEEVGFELGSSEGISPFGAVSYAFREGETTVFIGGKAGVEVPGTTIGLSAHDGVYVTFDSSGRVSDGGIRVSVGAEAGVTENISEAQAVKVDISIVNGVIST